VLVAAAHNRRFLAPMQALKHLVEAGRLGKILHVETHFSSNSVGRYPPGSWRVAEGESPAGGLAGSGIHQIDTIIHLAGPIAEVFAWTARRVHEVPFDDTTAVLFRLASGGSAALTTITATAATYRVVVFGTAGKAELDGDAAVRGSETLTVTGVDGARETIGCEPRDIERAEIEAFAAAIRGGAPYPIADDEVLNGVAAFEAVSLSAAAGRPIKL
jgi:predicted dehydrogenase